MDGGLFKKNNFQSQEAQKLIWKDLHPWWEVKLMHQTSDRVLMLIFHFWVNLFFNSLIEKKKLAHNIS